MFDPNNFFNSLFLIPILNTLIGLYKLLLVLKIPGALGFSVILLTITIRLVLSPFTLAQLKSAHKLSKLKPQLDKLAQTFKNDKQRLHQEQLRLYKEAGVNPAAGCLPLLFQMPILIALYNLFFQLLGSGNITNVVEGINQVVYFPFLKIESLDLSFFGIKLASKPSDFQKDGVFLLLIPVITALLQYWQTKMMTPHEHRPKSKEQRTEGKKDSKEPTTALAVAGKEEDMGAVMQKQMAVMMPLMIGFFAYSFPVGLSLYWNTFTVFGIIQQYQLDKNLTNKHE